jgi:hypothetical protein
MSIQPPFVKVFARAGRILVAAIALSCASPAAAAVPHVLKDALGSPSVKVRIVGITSIAKIKDPEVVGLIGKMLSDPEPTVRAAAVSALQTLKDPAAIALLQTVAADSDPKVKAAAGKAIAALEAGAVFVDIGDVEDISGGGIDGLAPLLQSGVEKEIAKLVPGVALKKGGVSKGYGLLLKIRSVNRVMQGENGVLEIKCDMTLMELPGKILRLSSSATAGAGVEGAIPKSMEKELATDGIAACAPSLAKDFAEYAQQRMRKK